MSNRFGNLFSIATFGESHGASVGVVIDGCPACMELTEADIQPQLDRRRPGQSSLTTPRKEADQARIIAGTENGITLGAPITILVDNRDQKPEDYKKTNHAPRPSHADFTYKSKYGILASSGGGRASARETIGRVAGGSVADKLLRTRHGVEIVAWVSSVGLHDAPDLTGQDLARSDVDSTAVRCPDTASAEKMVTAIEEVRDAGDSLGGIITCECRNIPAGWGEPVFDKIDACLAKAMLSMPAVKGFEVGSGFSGTRLRGSQHNDMFVQKKGRLGTASNRSGGIQGGITNGEPIVFRVAFKPVATITTEQETVNYDGEPVTLQVQGRHDPCVLPRAVPIVETMAALVLADMALMGR